MIAIEKRNVKCVPLQIFVCSKTFVLLILCQLLKAENACSRTIPFNGDLSTKLHCYWRYSTVNLLSIYYRATPCSEYYLKLHSAVTSKITDLAMME